MDVQLCGGAPGKAPQRRTSLGDGMQREDPGQPSGTGSIGESPPCVLNDLAVSGGTTTGGTFDRQDRGQEFRAILRYCPGVTPVMCLKHRGEVALVGKPRLEGGGGDGPSAFEECPGPANADLCLVGVWGQSGLVAKDPYEVECAETCDGGQPCERDVLAEMCFDDFARELHPAAFTTDGFRDGRSVGVPGDQLCEHPEETGFPFDPGYFPFFEAQVQRADDAGEGVVVDDPRLEKGNAPRGSPSSRRRLSPGGRNRNRTYDRSSPSPSPHVPCAPHPHSPG